MKVKELVTLLEDYDPELSIVVSGYEDGFEDFSVKLQLLSHHPDSPYYSGEYKISLENTENTEILCLIRNHRYP